MATFIRHIGLHHIALFRAHLEQTIDVSVLADRYLETGTDLPAAKRALALVETALVAAARRRGLHGAAVLLRVPRHRLGTSVNEQRQACARLSLEEFAEGADPHGFLSERELIELYTATHHHADGTDESNPKSRIPARNQRLLTKKILLVNDLAGDIARDPVLDDRVEGWFDPRVAKRLTAVGLRTLKELLDLINYRGYRWYVLVPRLGQVTAQRIMSFIAATPLGVQLQSHALVPKSQIRASKQELGVSKGVIVPLEGFRSPAEIDGSSGRNRADRSRNKLDATNDLQAVRAWLSLYRGSTERAYRKEAERLLLWAVFQQRKPLSGLNTEDLGEYVLFLEDPQPAAIWQANKRHDRYHPAWRPFIRGGLSRSSIAYALTVLGSMSAWLVGQRYLDSNPFDGLPTYQAHRGLKTVRSLSVAQWDHVKSVLRAMLQDDPATPRLRFLVKLSYGTGLRLHELAKATIGDIRTRQLGTDFESSAFLHVVGKGQREREVPLSSAIVKELRAYLSARGLVFESLRDLPSNTPLLAQHDGTSALSERWIYDVLKRFFSQAADELIATNADAAASLRSASTHWLRHTHATHALRNSVSLRHVQDNLGHASLTTTSIYLHSEDSERYQETNDFVNANDF